MRWEVLAGRFVVLECYWPSNYQLRFLSKSDHDVGRWPQQTRDWVHGWTKRCCDFELELQVCLSSCPDVEVAAVDFLSHVLSFY